MLLHLLLLGLEHVALAAHWNVALTAADELLLVRLDGAKREGRLMEAKLANGVQLLDLLCLWD